MLQPPPLSLYIHLPWCVRKCPYCDFNSYQADGEIPEGAYIDALVADLEQSLPQVWGRRVVSVFMGGGTPSLFSPEAIDRLLQAMRTRLFIEPLAEITLEANPGTADGVRFTEYRSAGVTRLSLGVQSFHDAPLAALQRIHDGARARSAAEAAVRAFDNVNFDLIYGLPGQSVASVREEARIALDLGPAHLSAYQLTLEPGTVFFQAPPDGLPDEDCNSAVQDALRDALAAGGFNHYETSAHARTNRECQHNLNYWTFGDYLGLGAGAHGKLTLPDGIVRQERWRNPQTWMQKVTAGTRLEHQTPVSAADLPFEFMMNALRLNQGVPASLFPARTGLPLASLAPQLLRAQARGLLEKDPHSLCPTPRGRDFLNELLQMFLPEG